MPPRRTRNESESSVHPLLTKPIPNPSIELAQQLYRASRASEEGYLVHLPRRLPPDHPSRLPILPPPPLRSPTQSYSSSYDHDTETTSSCCASPVKLPSAPLPTVALAATPEQGDPDWFVRRGKEKHHPYDPKQVPYWLSYEPEVIDHHILMMYASSPEPFRLLGAPPAGPFTVLDFGCGPSAHWALGALAANPRTASIVALDMCSLLLPRPLPKGLTFVQHDFLNAPLPFPDHTFNHVRVSFIASAVPEHQYAEVLEEIKRVLKPEGALDILETNAIPNSVLDARFLTPYPLSLLPAQLAMLGLVRLERRQVEGHRALLRTTRRAALGASRWCSTEPKPPTRTRETTIASLLGEKFGWYCDTDEAAAAQLKVQEAHYSTLLETCEAELIELRQTLYTSEALLDGARHEEQGSFERETRRKAQLSRIIQSLKSELATVTSRLEAPGGTGPEKEEETLTIESIVAYKT